MLPVAVARSSSGTYLRRQYLSCNLGELLTFPVPADDDM